MHACRVNGNIIYLTKTYRAKPTLEFDVSTHTNAIFKTTYNELRLTTRVGVNSAPELDFLANSKSNSGIGIELELALLSPGGIGIELELPSFELELESELLSSELNSELPSWN